MGADRDGVIVQYNTEKGYGFISSEGLGNCFFHISDLHPRNMPPAFGKRVSFSLITQPDGRLRANNVLILNDLEQQREPSLPLSEFICVRSASVKDYQIARSFGKIEAKHVTTFLLPRPIISAIDARNELIKIAKSKGANAILSFYSHSERATKQVFVERPGWFASYWKAVPTGNTHFWAEGEAVELKRR